MFILSFFQVIISGCVKDAERDNPLDPGAGNYDDSGSINGQVFTYYQPYQPIPDAEIVIKPHHFWTRSDAFGNFAFDRIPPGEYVLYVSRQGYSSDSVIVSLESKGDEYFQFNLNGLPELVSHTIKIGHISRWWPIDDLYLLIAQAEVTDPDGLADITSVQMTVPDYEFSQSLERTTNWSIFTITLHEDQLPVSSVQQFLGYPFFFQTIDVPGDLCTSAPIYAARIIETTPTPLSPQGLETITQYPTLEWQQTKLSFNFSYRIEIYRIDQGYNTLIYQLPDVDMDSTNLDVEQYLDSGTYFWTVSVVDEFGNWSRSKEASFIVP